MGALPPNTSGWLLAVATPGISTNSSVEVAVYGWARTYAAAAAPIRAALWPARGWSDWISWLVSPLMSRSISPCSCDPVSW